MRDKKAQLGIQFNWLFVLIVGAIILAFFLTVINNQQKRVTVAEASELVETLDTVFNTLNTNPDTVQNFSIGNAKIEFVCEEGLSEYYIQGVGPEDTTYEPIFTQESLFGDTIMTWTQTWLTPYESGVLTYMASDRVLFVFATDSTSSFVYELYTQMPDNFIKTVSTINNVEDVLVNGFDHYVIITDDAVPVSGSWDDKVVIKRLASNDPTNGFIEFTTKGNAPVSYPYFTEGLLWGALFAADEEVYACTANKAINRMKIVATILKHRADALAGELVATTCYDFFITASGFFEDQEETSKLTTTSTSAAFYAPIDGLERQTEIMRRGYTCPELY